MNTIFVAQNPSNNFQSEVLESYRSLIGHHDIVYYDSKNLEGLKGELYERLLKSPDSLVICDDSLELLIRVIIAKSIQIIQYGASPFLSFFYSKSQIITLNLEEFRKHTLSECYLVLQKELTFLDLDQAFLKASKLENIPVVDFNFEFINKLFSLKNLSYLTNLNDDFFSPSQEKLVESKLLAKKNILAKYNIKSLKDNTSWHICLSNYLLSDQECLLLFDTDLSAMKLIIHGRILRIDNWTDLLQLLEAFDTYENLSSWKRVNSFLNLLYSSPKKLEMYKHEQMIDTYHKIRLNQSIKESIIDRIELSHHFNPLKAVWASNLKEIYQNFSHFNDQKYYFSVTPDLFTASFNRKFLKIDFPKKEFIRYELDLGEEASYFFQTIYGKNPEFRQTFS